MNFKHKLADWEIYLARESSGTTAGLLYILNPVPPFSPTQPSAAQKALKCICFLSTFTIIIVNSSLY